LFDVDDVLLGNSEYSVRVMGLVSFLLQCNASNLVLEISKLETIRGGQFALAFPHAKFWGNSFPTFPVIYAHESRDVKTGIKLQLVTATGRAVGL